MPRRLIIVLLLLLTMTAGVTWFLKNFEQVEVEVTANVTEEVRQNPLLAAERFLRANGYETESTTGRDLLNALPPNQDILIINNFFSSLSADTEENLLDWIRNGGHLFITPRKSWSEDDKSGYSLLDNIGVHRHGTRLEIFGIELDVLNLDSALEFSYPGIEEPLEAAFRTSTWLHMDGGNPEYAIPVDRENAPGIDNMDQARYHLLQARLGRGLVTVTSDNLFLTNSFIGKFDHAFLLSLLTDKQGKVWLLYDKSMPSLWSLLLRHSSPFMAAATLLLLLSLWYAMRRSGPLLSTDESGRRDLIEHLDATSRFHWRNRNRQYVTASTRELVRDYWYRQHSFLADMPEEEQVVWISKHSGLEEEDIRSALFSDQETAEQLVRQAQTLQLLRLRIHRG